MSPDVQASRLSWDETGVGLEDLESLGGTWVAGKDCRRTPTQPRQVAPGDVVTIGQSCLTWLHATILPDPGRPPNARKEIGEGNWCQFLFPPGKRN
jgi:hypothetical protein